MNCPECTQPMTPLPCQTPINYASDVRWEKWICRPCKLIGRVETIFWHDESVDAVSDQPCTK